MNALGFRLERADNGAWAKIRDDGRRGPAVADEAPLWQALEAERAESAKLRGAVRELSAQVRQHEAAAMREPARGAKK